MKLTAILTLLSLATIAVSASPKPATEHLTERQCLPSSCVAGGCCSGDCDYWCRQCDIKFTC
ncbi:hypothetical protein BDB00DRAFT_836886 [Zychaea mexicana]|uniref:uncharacterized protein n=1 Tax=Zychaea mexicana TaxID=64656 RepID=UPI0022FE7FA7|nr:uncharacterized protein BDB00DRAFT_836886 [Zychaea mexicana]KAI9490677.1 hypothetical protein BDB00DRAFT_836886 [Zychaea mexicana]